MHLEHLRMNYKLFQVRNIDIKSQSILAPDIHTFVKKPWPNTIFGRSSPADISIAGQ